CRQNHGCSSPDHPERANYPSRLLDVGMGEDEIITLQSTGTFQNEEYVCLSHCWGKTRPLTLNGKTRAALTKGIDVAKLPQTFQDAVKITRRLHIQYLWIDSLCILQDDKSDWEVESGHMGYVYAGAVCTIAATVAKNSDGGLFSNRGDLLPPSRIDANFDASRSWLADKVNGFLERQIDEAPLNKRAWVSQERQLSRRIMHFGSQLFWECYESQACEMYPVSLPDWALPDPNSDTAKLREKLHHIADQPESNMFSSSHPHASKQGLDLNTYHAWSSFRDKYSKCELTHDGDKLVAIHGIAQRIGQATGDELVAGLWRSRIAEELCWFKKRPATEPTKWRAPTWSWASTN
ncbi:HET-domain-containing protein, partial [Polyplosphaeria fusca]